MFSFGYGIISNDKKKKGGGLDIGKLSAQPRSKSNKPPPAAAAASSSLSTYSKEQLFKTCLEVQLDLGADEEASGSSSVSERVSKEEAKQSAGNNKSLHFITGEEAFSKTLRLSSVTAPSSSAAAALKKMNEPSYMRNIVATKKQIEQPSIDRIEALSAAAADAASSSSSSSSSTRRKSKEGEALRPLRRRRRVQLQSWLQQAEEEEVQEADEAVVVEDDEEEEEDMYVTVNDEGLPIEASSDGSTWRVAEGTTFEPDESQASKVSRLGQNQQDRETLSLLIALLPLNLSRHEALLVSKLRFVLANEHLFFCKEGYGNITASHIALLTEVVRRGHLEDNIEVQCLGIRLLSKIGRVTLYHENHAFSGDDEDLLDAFTDLSTLGQVLRAGFQRVVFNEAFSLLRMIVKGRRSVFETLCGMAYAQSDELCIPIPLDNFLKSISFFMQYLDSPMVWSSSTATAAMLALAKLSKRVEVHQAKFADSISLLPNLSVFFKCTNEKAARSGALQVLSALLFMHIEYPSMIARAGFLQLCVEVVHHACVTAQKGATLDNIEGAKKLNDHIGMLSAFCREGSWRKQISRQISVRELELLFSLCSPPSADNPLVEGIIELFSTLSSPCSPAILRWSSVVVTGLVEDMCAPSCSITAQRACRCLKMLLGACSDVMIDKRQMKLVLNETLGSGSAGVPLDTWKCCLSDALGALTGWHFRNATARHVARISFERSVVFRSARTLGTLISRIQSSSAFSSTREAKGGMGDLISPLFRGLTEPEAFLPTHSAASQLHAEPTFISPVQHENDALVGQFVSILNTWSSLPSAIVFQKLVQLLAISRSSGLSALNSKELHGLAYMLDAILSGSQARVVSPAAAPLSSSTTSSSSFWKSSENTMAAAASLSVRYVEQKHTSQLRAFPGMQKVVVELLTDVVSMQPSALIDYLPFVKQIIFILNKLEFALNENMVVACLEALNAAVAGAVESNKAVAAEHTGMRTLPLVQRFVLKNFPLLDEICMRTSEQSLLSLLTLARHMTSNLCEGCLERETLSFLLCKWVLRGLKAHNVTWDDTRSALLPMEACSLLLDVARYCEKESGLGNESIFTHVLSRSEVEEALLDVAFSISQFDGSSNGNFALTMEVLTSHAVKVLEALTACASNFNPLPYWGFEPHLSTVKRSGPFPPRRRIITTTSLTTICALLAASKRHPASFVLVSCTSMQFVSALFEQLQGASQLTEVRKLFFPLALELLKSVFADEQVMQQGRGSGEREGQALEKALSSSLHLIATMLQVDTAWTLTQVPSSNALVEALLDIVDVGYSSHKSGVVAVLANLAQYTGFDFVSCGFGESVLTLAQAAMTVCSYDVKVHRHFGILCRSFAKTNEAARSLVMESNAFKWFHLILHESRGALPRIRSEGFGSNNLGEASVVGDIAADPLNEDSAVACVCQSISLLSNNPDRARWFAKIGLALSITHLMGSHPVLRNSVRMQVEGLRAILTICNEAPEYRQKLLLDSSYERAVQRSAQMLDTYQRRTASGTSGSREGDGISRSSIAFLLAQQQAQQAGGGSGRESGCLSS